jgi:hypothetical protein
MADSSTGQWRKHFDNQMTLITKNGDNKLEMTKAALGVILAIVAVMALIFGGGGSYALMQHSLSVNARENERQNRILVIIQEEIRMNKREMLDYSSETNERLASIEAKLNMLLRNNKKGE